VRLRRAAASGVAVVTAAVLGAVALGGAPGAHANGYVTMSPLVWKAGTENLQLKVEGGDCGSYDVGMIDRIQLKDYYSPEAAFYGYEPVLVEPEVDRKGEKLWEGPVQIQSSAVNGKHEIDLYCEENDRKIGTYDVNIVEGKPPKKKPKKCGDGKVLEKGKCVPKGPVKIPNPNPH
jgi:hypothetical protein